MEEISWAQTFRGWRSPDSVASWNYQNETNLHNAFNLVLGRAYLAAGIIGFLAEPECQAGKRMTRTRRVAFSE
jgi:hypothetical protein